MAEGRWRSMSGEEVVDHHTKGEAETDAVGQGMRMGTRALIG